MERIIVIDKEVPKKRPRTENWLDQDKLLLKEEVRKRVRAIENKNTDTNSNHNKKEAWADLQNIFNSQCHGVRRTIPQLKSQWCLIKMMAKKDKPDYRRQIITTEGGLCPDAGRHHPDDISSTVDSNEFDYDSWDATKNISTDDILCCNDTVKDIKIEILPCSPEEVRTSAEDIPAAQEDPLQQELSINRDDASLIQSQTKGVIRNKYKKSKILKKTNKIMDTTTAAAKIMEHENTCRRELHDVQMANERKRARNLDLEYKVLAAKLSFYENK